MNKITKEFTENLMSAILGRKFIPEVDSAHALYIAKRLEDYHKEMLESECRHTIDDLVLIFKNRATCKCGTEFHFDA